MTGMGWATDVVAWVGQLFTVVVEPEELPDPSIIELPDEPELDVPDEPELEETPEEDEESLEAASGSELSPWVSGEGAPLLPQPLAIARTREPMQSALPRVIVHVTVSQRGLQTRHGEPGRTRRAPLRRPPPNVTQIPRIAVRQPRYVDWEARP